uniref:Uncharacterized protein n=1 Tax=Rhizobium rhizogenes TaxID=359 RepID=A0A7S5DRV0_RHIRH|nr:hypothetical protein pC5.8a_118 [Rhizobium rhizogenes]
MFLRVIGGCPEFAMFLDNPIQLTGDPQAGQRSIGDDVQAFSGAIVDDR